MQTAPLIDRLPGVLDDLPRLATRWTGAPWTWDLRFQCAVSTCASDIAEQAREVLFDTLPELYDHSRLVLAPQAIREQVVRTGGLRPGQHVYVGPPLPDGSIPFALWWPWADGCTVSVRVGATRP